MKSFGLSAAEAFHGARRLGLRSLGLSPITGVGVPAGYFALLYQDGSGNSRVLNFQNADSAYRPLAFKAA